MAIWDRFKKKQEQATDKARIASDAVKKTAQTEEKLAKTPAKAASEKPTSDAAKYVASAASKQTAQTILAPVVTEKSANMSAQGVMVFRVAGNANRVQVRNAFRELYKVTPVSVNIVNVRGKHVRFGRHTGRRVDVKKAYITLPEGVHIDIFEGV